MRCLTIAALLRDHAKNRPEETAILTPGQAALAYGSLWKFVEQLAPQLRAIGIERNSRVAIVLPDGAEMAVALLAVSAVATVIPLSPKCRSDEFASYFSHAKARFLLVQSGMTPAAVEVARAAGINVLEITPAQGEAGRFTLCGPGRVAAAAVDYAEPDDCLIVMQTAGTTAVPKIAPVSHRKMLLHAEHSRTPLRLTSADRYLNLMPLFQKHGFAKLLATVIAGGSTICVPNFRPMDFCSWLEELSPTWYSAVPSIHEAILTCIRGSDGGLGPHRLRFIRSGSAALPVRLRVALEETFGIPVIEGYAATGAGIVACNPVPPGLRKSGSVGLAAGVEIAVVDEKGHPLKPGETGHIAVRGETVIDGFENNPSANEAAFRHGWFFPGDLGWLDEEGYLFLKDRSEETINRAGEKISPGEIEEVLLAHPGVAEAAAFPAPDAVLGQSLGAAVVLRAVPGEDELRQFVAARLAPSKVPARIRIVPEIPKSSTGKVERLKLPERLGNPRSVCVGPKGASSPAVAATNGSQPASFGARAKQQSRPAAPAAFDSADPTEQKLARVWEEVVGRLPDSGDENFFEVGGQSLLATAMLARMEQEFRKPISLATLWEAPTIKRLAALLRSAGDEPLNSPVVPMNAGGSRPPFFVVLIEEPDLTQFQALAAELGPEQPLYGLITQYRNRRDEPYSSVEEMAAGWVKEIRRIQRHGPYYLGGVSAGGIVAIAIAQELIATRDEVRTVAMVDTHFPIFREDLLAMNPVWRPIQIVDNHIRELLFRSPGECWSYVIAQVKNRVSGLAQRKLMLLKGRPLGELPAESPRESLIRIYRSYQPGVYPGRITLLLAAMDRVRSYNDIRLRWSYVAGGGLDVHLFPGSHATMLQSPGLPYVGRYLRERLIADQAAISPVLLA